MADHDHSSEVRPDSTNPQQGAPAPGAGEPQGHKLNGGGQPLTHDKAMTLEYLAVLDPTTDRFTFQTFDDNQKRKSPRLARVLHGTLDEHWAELVELNNRGAGIFVTVNATDFRGRSSKNITRVRVLVVDADGGKQMTHCMQIIQACGIKPSMAVITGRGMHIYFVCPDIPLDQFSTLQKSLIIKLGTDSAIHDLPRVMRLPGFLHLKDPAKPRRVKLYPTNGAVRTWALAELVEKLGLSAAPAGDTDASNTAGPMADRFKHLKPDAGLGGPEQPPLLFAPIKEGCPWFKDAHETGGKTHDQSQWHLAVLSATFLEDGHAIAHAIGDKYPGSTEAEREAMWDREIKERKEKDLGWPSCKAIAAAGSKFCKACPHFNKGESPLHLALHNAALPAIRIVKGEIARVVDEAEAALIAVTHTAPIMVRAGMLVQPIVDLLPASHGRMTEVALLRPLTAANLIYLLNKHAATFKQFDRRSNKWLTVDPPAAVATQLLEKGRWQFPKVAGVITAPTLRPDGSLLNQPGYDPATQLWYRPDSQLVLPQLPEVPTYEQAQQALALLTDLLTNFPFEHNVDRSVALAAILTTVLRGAFVVVPMNLLRAHDVGNGKSYLADVISVIARGQVCPVITNVKSVEEMEKRLGALVLEGVPIISLDNCSDDIGGDLLCQITERRLVRIRILGKSETPECEWRGVLFASGNNVAYRGDMTRRGLIANLDAKIERPELREFSFDPIERVLADRGRYIAAALIIARAYIAAGSPKVCGSLGSYGAWSDFVRSPLIWLGQDDPVKSMDTAREDDPVRHAEHSLIGIWRAHLGLNVGYTAAELIEKSHAGEWVGAASEQRFKPTCPDLRELLLQQAGTPRGDIDPRKVSSWLLSMHGRVHDGHCLARVKVRTGHGNTFALLKV
jgi:hypothetical protein